MRTTNSRALAAAWMLWAAIAGCGGRSRDEGAEADSAGEAVATVRAEAIAVRTFPDVVIAPGQWRSNGELVISAPFAATIDSLAPRVGDPVRSGETLGWIVTRESQAAVHGAELLLGQSRDEASRQEATRALALARRDLVRVPLVSPRAGVVVRRSAEIGSQASEGSEILAIIPRGSIVFEAHVPPQETPRLSPGQRARITESASAAKEATLQRVLPTASQSDQTTLVWLAPGPGGPDPELDRFGSATITLGPDRQAPAVPDSAVVEDDLTGATRVATVDAAGRAKWITVSLGAGAAGWRELKSPALSPGTKVIVDGQHGLPDDARVSVKP